MRESIQDSVTRLLRYQHAPEKATSLFRTLKHNADILPKLQAVLEMILQAYGKFEDVVYDVQGPRDDGSDVVLHCRAKDDEAEPELISFQVKSFDDLAKKNYMQELKAQRDDSFRKVRGLRYYFLLVCTDSKAHRDRVRNIMAEFRSADRTEVIEPTFAYTFLNHPKTRVDAFIKRLMEADDFVFRRALESLDLSSPSARALAVFLSTKSVLTGLTQFNLDHLLTDASLRSIYKELQDQDEDEWMPARDFEEQISADLDILENVLVERDSASDNVRLRADEMRPLNAVATDALVRYEYNGSELLSYMFDLMIRQ
jgi:hypothetical protein